MNKTASVRKEYEQMELKRLDKKEILQITEQDNILEYKISRTEDNRLILEIKVDISHSLIDIATLTQETFPE